MVPTSAKTAKPPRLDSFSIIATLQPSLAAEIAAETPAVPPPTTIISKKLFYYTAQKNPD